MTLPRWLAAILLGLLLASAMLAPGASAQQAVTVPGVPGPARIGSRVGTVKLPDGSYQYQVNGKAQAFIGVGYNPI
ncbi:MAG TPA: hypothetical protein VKU60_16860, partial [Chloroflexota bacterium]|nr:hypothetical protein [Chloroflexota bacterium]